MKIVNKVTCLILIAIGICCGGSKNDRAFCATPMLSVEQDPTSWIHADTKYLEMIDILGIPDRWKYNTVTKLTEFEYLMNEHATTMRAVPMGTSFVVEVNASGTIAAWSFFNIHEQGVRVGRNVVQNSERDDRLAMSFYIGSNSLIYWEEKISLESISRYILTKISANFLSSATDEALKVASRLSQGEYYCCGVELNRIPAEDESFFLVIHCHEINKPYSAGGSLRFLVDQDGRINEKSIVKTNRKKL
jgi:hypothetical protein